MGVERKRRTWIDLPKVPPELLEPAKADDPFEIQIERWRLLEAYFQTTNGDGAALALAMATRIFPAFQKPIEPGKAGRPLSSAPKHSVEFLKGVAALYVAFITRQKQFNASSSGDQSFKRFLKENPQIADKLVTSSKTLQRSSFLKLVKVGERAATGYVIWSRHPGDHFSWRSGDFVELHPVVAGIYEALRLSPSLSSLGLATRLLSTDPRSLEGQRAINAIAVDVEQQHETNLRLSVLGVPAFRHLSGFLRADPMWLLKKNGKFNLQV